MKKYKLKLTLPFRLYYPTTFRINHGSYKISKCWWEGVVFETHEINDTVKIIKMPCYPEINQN